MSGFRGEFVDDESYDPSYDSDEGFEPDPCECLEPDVDILIGRAHCISCGRAWWMTRAEFAAEMKFQAESYEAYAAEFMADAVADT